MAIKRPPEHRADAPPLLIHADDDAWDHERIERERKALAKEHKEAKRPGSPPLHPWDAYIKGHTRFDLDARATIGGTTVSMREYLREGVKPTVFHLRRVSGRRWTQSVTRVQSSVLTAAANADEMWGLARVGLAKVTDGFEDGPDARWPLEGGEGGQPLTEDDLQTLFDAGQGLVIDIGSAILTASGPITEAEGKP